MRHFWVPFGREDAENANKGKSRFNDRFDNMKETNKRKDKKADWKKFYDVNAKAHYWYNDKTGEASWTMPFE